ncbi:MAG: hypothetical protein J6V44_05275 [Methanobrevibacter sp.]|nr:hypothetical protein [Methanobrevibacter sp.]
MMKNDITYEYRVFTHRLFDVESMEVGICTSKAIKEIKPKDKVNGRFFHTSDTDEWFFCWNNELQKLNLKGNSDVNTALAEVEKLIANANAAVSDAKKTATEAKNAAAEAKTAADAASAAVESIEGKADQSAVEAVEKAVELKADKTDVEALAASIPTVPTNVSAFTNDAGYLTSHQDISGKQDVIADLATIRANAELGATAIQEIPDTYATKTYVAEQIEGINLPTVPTNVSEFTNDAGYLTKDVADGYYAALGTTGSGNGVDKNYVDTELAKKQNIIDDIDDIRTKANSALQSIPEDYITSEELEGKGYLTEHQDISGKQDVITDLEDIRTKANNALQSIPDEYVTDEELEGKGYLTSHQDISGKQDVISDLETIRSGAAAGATALQAQALDNYYTIEQIDNMIGVAIEKTNTILNA